VRSNLARLDRSIDVLNDDRGRVVLLPRDHRQPLRLDPDVWARLASYDEGSWSIRTDTSSQETGQPGLRGAGLVAKLDQQGMLDGRRSAPSRRTMHFPGVARQFDRLARLLSAPVVPSTSIETRGRLILAAGAVTFGALAVLWWFAEGRMFAGVVSPNWWVGLLVFFAAFPFVHEFSHAFAARLFELPVTAVGAQHNGGLRWSPFVEVRHAALSSNPAVRVSLPIIGVLCNLMIALVAGTAFVLTAPDTLANDIAGIAVGLAHLRVLVDGGFGARTDATQALRYSKEFDSPGRHRLLRYAMRGGWCVFAAATVAMLALSIGSAGAGAIS
jgi:hypothetical protein